MLLVVTLAALIVGTQAQGLDELQNLLKLGANLQGSSGGLANLFAGISGQGATGSTGNGNSSDSEGSESALTAILGKLGINPGDAIKSLTDDLEKNFNIADLFPELGDILGNDPIGALPVEAIANSQIRSANQLFKAPSNDEVPEQKFEEEEQAEFEKRANECLENFKLEASVFATKFRAQGGASINSYYWRHRSEILRCNGELRRGDATRTRNLAQLDAGLNQQSAQFNSMGSKLAIPVSSSQSEKFASFMDGAMERKTGGSVGDVGTFFRDDARGTCRRLTNAELPIEECAERVERLCDLATELGDLGATASFESPAELRATIAAFAPEGRQPHQGPRPQSAAASCRCLGDTMRRGLMSAGRGRAARGCVAATAERVEAGRNPARRRTLSEEFLAAQAPDADVDFSAVLAPDQLNVSNLPAISAEAELEAST